jgi:hypothetical protein
LSITLRLKLNQNLVTQEAEIGGSQFEARLGKKVSETLSQKNKPGLMVNAYNSATWEAEAVG